MPYTPDYCIRVYVINATCLQVYIVVYIAYVYISIAIIQLCVTLSQDHVFFTDFYKQVLYKWQGHKSEHIDTTVQ